MSEHQDGQREPWKEKLVHAFKVLKETDNELDKKLRHNRDAVERIFRDVLPPVFAQFGEDAKEYGFRAEVGPQQNGSQKLTLQGPTSCTFEFRREATSDTAKVIATRVGGPQVNLLQNKSPEHFQESDLGEFLAAQLHEVTPKKR
jgi:hypothetical protein